MSFKLLNQPTKYMTVRQMKPGDIARITDDTAGAYRGDIVYMAYIDEDLTVVVSLMAGYGWIKTEDAFNWKVELLDKGQRLLLEVTED